ncbi:SWIM zinc finger family protein [Streptomyces sp. NPDC020996]|uniref:SWIM zinc finger family protein n=1 Tax=Streptomyces sp. NPDC020996 TaxID=3154791 RepID=UPI0033F12A8A
MTPGPADEARRALRQARERRAGDSDVEDPPVEAAEGAAGRASVAEGSRGETPLTEDADGRSPGPGTSAREPRRPADAARAALRQAVSARRVLGSAAAGGIAEEPAAAPAPGDAAGETPAEGTSTEGHSVNSPDTEAGSPADGGAGRSGGGAAAPAGDRKTGRSARDAEPAPGVRPSPPGGAGTRGPRPADIAREALRAALRHRQSDADRTDPGRTDTGRRNDYRTDAGRTDTGRRNDDRTDADAEPRHADRVDADRRISDPRSPDPRSPEHRAPEHRSPEHRAPEHRAPEHRGPEHRNAGPAREPRRPSARAAGGPQARSVGELLAGAFGMPSEDATTRPKEVPPPSGPAHSGHGDDSHGGGEVGAIPAFPAVPTVPRSMAAPSRDGDLRRTFAAFPPRSSGGDARFAETWWGNAWVTTLEEGALDAKRLARGRGYAEQGHVDAITVTPGLVLAYVQGSRPRPYRVQVRLRTLDDADWDRFLDAAVERPGHIAALLDKELPHSLADCGVPLLPGPGDLEPHCSCPDRGHPCKHAAALCYQTARLLDADPFVLLLLRGRGERELLDALSRLSAARAARAARDREPAPLPGVRATDAVARRQLPPLPPPLPAPPHPGQPPVYPAAPGGPDPFALDQLATDAAARAHALLVTGDDPVAELTLWQDAVRLAAARPGSGLTVATRALYSSLATAAGRTPAELARAVAAWRQGGPEGLAVLEEPWDPPAGRFDRARPLLLAADLPPFRPWHNRLTHPRGHVQLRLGRDGLWYAYESEPGHDDWWPRGTPDPDPVGALTGLGTSSGV